jgi:hypothetical protein
MCFCTGHAGGDDPGPGVDETHWECGKQRHRSDGCPDDVAAGTPCTGDRVCSEVEDMCYAPHRCVAGTWGPIDNALCPKRP